MGRKRRAPAPKKKRGGLLIGMRSGFKGTVNAVTGAGAEKAKKPSLAGNLITAALVVIAAVLLLRRCGYASF